MKTVLLSILIFTFAGIAQTFNNNGLYSIDSALVAFYPFNGNANDQSGNNNNGIVIGASLTTDRFGNTNNAYQFNGTSDNITVVDNLTLNLTNEITLAAWVKRTRYGIDMIMEKGGDWTHGTCNYGMSLHSMNNNMFYFFFNGGWRGTGGVNDFEWHHYTVIAQQGNTNPLLYIDGELKQVQYSEGAAIINLATSTLDLHIGAQVGTATYYGANVIDEVRIYNRTLSQTEISQLAGNGLVAFYPFNGNANDESDFVNNGTSYGASLTTDRFGNPNTAYSFDGDDYIQINNADQLNFQYSTPLSISGWFNVSSFTASQAEGIVAKWGNATGEFGYGIAVDENHQLTFALDQYGYGRDNAVSSNIIQPNNWYHFVGTWDGAEMKLYLNSTLELTVSRNYQGSISSQPLYIGKQVFLTGEYNGKIDDVRIHNFALSESEVSILYHESGWATVTDTDGNVYPTVVIGTQEWMAENLKTTKYSTSYAIQNVIDDATWAGLATGAYCWYNNDYETYGGTYGALYNWYAVADSRNICPIGWHVPTDAEWTTLSDFLGGAAIAGGKLKEVGFEHWTSPNTDATDEIGFGALPGGRRYFNDGTFHNLTGNGYWWSNSEVNASYSWFRGLTYDGASLNVSDYGKQGGFSVRCLKNDQYTDLVAYYPFNNSGNDESGNENHAAAGNYIAQGVDRFGGGTAYLFDGADDYFVATHSSSYDFTGEITVSTWINPSVVNIAQQSISSKGGGWNRSGWLITLNNDKIRWHLGDGGSESYFDTYTSIQSNKWTHVVAQWKDGVMNVYINGIKDINSSTWAAGLIANTYDHYIGRTDNEPFYFNGVIDDIRIYSRAISETEISQLYANFHPPKTLIAIPGDQQVTLKWSSERISEINQYFIYQDGVNVGTVNVSTVNDTVYTVTGLTNYQNYEFYITSTDIYSNVSQPSVAVNAIPVKNEIYAYWTFDQGNTNDQIGSNHGTIVGSNVGFTPGMVGSALQIGTPSSYVEIPSFNLPYITVEAWINSAGFGSYTSMVSKKWDVDGWNIPYGLWQLWFAEDTPNPGVITYNWSIASPEVQAMNQWFHMAYTYDGATMKLYINGVEKSSYFINSGPIPQRPGKIYIGKTKDSNHSFAGKIDEVAIWSYALSADEIQQHYQNGLNGLGYIPSQPTITDFLPKSGTIGTTVTISGSNFNTNPESNIVRFGAAQASITSATAIELVVTVPIGTTYQPISVTDITTGLTAYSAEPFSVTFPSSGVIDATSFTSAVDFASGTNTFYVSLTDIDGDGKLDMISTNSGANTFSVFRNISSEGSINASSFDNKVDFNTGSGPFTATIGDIDGDGKQDLAVANMTGNTISVFRNTSTSGTIDASSFAGMVDFTTGSGPRDIAIGDIDGDGKPDLAVANFYSNTVSVFRNISTSGLISAGSFAEKVDFATGNNPHYIAIGDIDGDSKSDLVVTNWGDGTVSVFRNTSTSGSIGATSFDVRVNYTVGTEPHSVSIGDIDGDNKADLAVVNAGSSNVSLLRNSSTPGSITLEAKVDFATGTHPTYIALGNIDGDAKPDLVVANNTSNSVSVLKNTSTNGVIDASSFATYVEFNTGIAPSYVAIGDIDGDNKPDLAIANYSSNTVSVLQNTIATPDLVAFYPFNGNANDESDNGNDGTNYGATPTTDRFGIENSAYSFDGISSYFTTPINQNQLGSTYSISFWANIENTSNFSYFVFYNNDNENNHKVHLVGVTGSLYLQMGDVGDPSTTSFNLPTPDFNSWENITLTYDNGNWKYYVNGILATQFSKTISNLNFSKIYWCTHEPITSSDYWLKGKMDDIRIYNNALSESEISDLYHENGWATVTDIDGNVYPTVIIGTQEWMAENLRTTKYSNGVAIDNVPDDAAWTGLTTGAYCWYNNDQTTYGSTYGTLYNWYAAADSRNLCPTGWHVPTDAEWYTMENYIDPTINDPNATGWRGTDGGTKLKATNSWLNSGNGTNNYGFSALPGGYRYWDNGTFINVDAIGTWWTSAESDNAYSWYRGLAYDSDNVHRFNNPKQFGFSVRCLKNNPTDLVAFYPFSGNTNDESGNSNHGTNNGATPTTDRFGDENSAYSFDGVDDYILVGDPVPDILQIQNEITLSAWIFLPGPPTNLGMIVGSQYDNTTSGASILIDNRVNGDGQTNPSGHIHFQIGNGTWHVTNSNSVVPTNQWVMITATRKANEDGKIYYNDQLQPSQSVAWDGSITYNSAWLAIGKQKDYPGREFHGFIDDVRVYNRALSLQEIQQLFDNFQPIPIVTTSLIGNITAVSAKSGGNVTSDGGSSVIARGVVWSTSQNPTLVTNLGFTSDGDGLDEFVSNITGLSPQTTYYVRAYATNSTGTAYGQQESFVTLSLATPITPYGSGTDEEPYLIENLGNLLWVCQDESTWDKYFKQTADIDASETMFWEGGLGWPRIGTSSTYFTGHYNGDGHIVNGLYIDRSGYEHQGFFGYTSEATITKLGITNATITGHNYVGALVGYSTDYSSVELCHSSGNIVGNSYVGGIVGESYYSSVSNCFSVGSVSNTGTWMVGGVVGYNDASTIENCYSRSIVSGTSYVGGLVGYNSNSSTINNCYSTGYVSGTSEVGGLVGYNSISQVNNSYWDTQTSGQPNSSGGLGRTTVQMTTYPYDADTYVGWNFSTIWGEDVNQTINDGYPFLYMEDFYLPTLSTTEATAVTQTTATSGGNITIDGGSPVTARGVVWSTSVNPTTFINQGITTNGTGTGVFESQITGLTHNTTYYVRAYATNGVGTAYGNQISFSTPIAAPVANFSADVTSGTAPLTVHFTDQSTNNPTSWYWDFGDENTTDQQNPVHIYYDEGTYTVSLTVTNTSGSDTETKENYIVVTSSATIPSVNTIAASNISYTSATAGGDVTSDGGDNVTIKGIVWDTNPNPTVDSNLGIETGGSGVGNYLIDINDLIPGTTYYVRAYATNNVGTAYGQQESFTTLFTTESQQPSGSGTSEDPYLIANLANLRWVSENSWAWDKHFLQTADIDATETTYWNSGEGWSPIGTHLTVFTGSYNGNNFSVNGLSISREATNYQGFFGKTNIATISNVRIVNASIAGYTYTGGVIGALMNNSQVTHCSFEGNVSGNDNVGGLVGFASYSNISKCFSKGTVTSVGSDAGGLVGQMVNNGIDNSYSRSSVVGFYDIGGLLGNNNTGSTVYRTFSTGSVSGTGQVGGLIGANNAAVLGSYWDMESSGQSSSAGGFGRTTDEMTWQYDYYTTFVDWDFSTVWAEDSDYQFNDGYPYLRAEEPVPPNVTTLPVENYYVTSHTAMAGGNVTAENSFPVTDRGIIWDFDSDLWIDYENYSGLVYSESGLVLYTAIMQPLSPSTTYYYRAFAISEAGYGYGEVFSFTTPAAMSLCQALDNCDLEFTTGGDSDWFGQSVTTHDEVDAMQSGYLGDNSYSEISTTIEGPGELSFWWRASAQDGDFLKLYINESLHNSITNISEWQNISIQLYEGINTIQWIFEKDGSGSEGEDCGWIDQVVYIPSGPTIPTVQTSSVTYITQTTATCGGNVVSDGGDDVYSRGVVWNTTGNPSFDDYESYTEDGTGTGEFVSELTGLTHNTTYYVRAYAVNSQGVGYGDQVEFITLSNVPVAEFWADNLSGYVPLTVQFNDISTNSPTSWSWSFGDGSTSTEQNPLYQYTSAGTFTVTLTVSNESGSDTEIKTDYITVYSSPWLPTVTTTPVTNITQNSATSGGNITYDGGYYVYYRGVVWSTAQNPTVDNNVGITYDGEGTGPFTSQLTGLYPNTRYYVRAYANNGVGTAYGNQISFATAYTITFIVYNESNSPINGATVTINGENQTTNSSGEAVFFMVNGTFEYSVAATGYIATGGWINVNNADQTVSIKLVSQSSSPPSIVGEQEVCRGSEIIYSINSPISGLWEVTGGSLISSNSTHLLVNWNYYIDNGKVRYRVVDGQGFLITYELSVGINKSQYLTSYDKPQIHIKGSLPILICTTSELTYKWYKNDDVIQGASKQYYVARSQSGEFRVQVDLKNQCPHTSNAVSISVLKEAQISVYPNPNGGNFTINVESNDYGEGIVMLTNAFGNVVYNESVQKNTQVLEQTISLPNLLQGVYIVWVRIGDSLPVQTKLTIL